MAEVPLVSEMAGPVKGVGEGCFGVTLSSIPDMAEVPLVSEMAGPVKGVGGGVFSGNYI